MRSRSAWLRPRLWARSHSAILWATMLLRARIRGKVIAASTQASTLAFSGTPARAHAADPDVAVGSSATGDPTTEHARELYGRGRAKYETFDDVGAIELWTEASARLPDGDQNADLRGKLMFNIAPARLEAHDIDENTSHLGQAQRLMDIHVASLGEGDEAAIAEAQQWHERIGQRLADAEHWVSLRRATRWSCCSPCSIRVTARSTASCSSMRSSGAARW